MLCAIPGSSDHGATRLRLLPIKGGRHVTNRETDGGETGANSSAVLPEKLCFRICRLPLHIATNPPLPRLPILQNKVRYSSRWRVFVERGEWTRVQRVVAGPGGQPWESRDLTSPCKLSFPYFNDHHNLLLPHTPLDVLQCVAAKGHPVGYVSE